MNRRRKSGGEGEVRRGDDKRKRSKISQKAYTSASDYEELRKAHRFVRSENADGEGGKRQKGNHKDNTWQHRMAKRYESELYREYVLADLTRVHLKGSPIGLRWRTKVEVLKGKGERTCGNKHCPSYGCSKLPSSIHYEDIPFLDDDESESTIRAELSRLSSMEYGAGLHSYEVPFSYVEDSISRRELVKLRLCIKCAPLLFYDKGGVIGAKKARDSHLGRKTSSDQKISSRNARKGGV